MKFRGDGRSDLSGTFPEGEYFLTCTHVQHLDKSEQPLKSKKGNDMWVLEFTVAEGEHKDRKLWHHLVFIPAGAPGHGMPLKCLKAFGIDPEGDTDILPEHLEGLTVKARVKVETSDEYDPANKVARFITPEGGLQKPRGGDTSFDPAELDKQAQPAVQPAPAPQAQPSSAQVQPQAAKKPLWGGKKK